MRSKQNVVYTHIRSIHYYRIIERNRCIELVWASDLKLLYKPKLFCYTMYKLNNKAERVMQAKIKQLVEKANKYAIYVETSYYASPEIVGYSAKGKRILRRVDRLLKAV